MSKANTNMIIKRIVDAALTVLLLLLMAYQVTGEVAHEWIGMGMTVLVVIHQILNRKWYGALFKGKYNPYRSITTVLNILLIASFALTAFCGMSMSRYAVPFLYGLAPVSFVRQMHLSMSHWAFVLMGLHLGMHIPAMTAGLKLNDKPVAAIMGSVIIGIALMLIFPAADGQASFGILLSALFQRYVPQDLMVNVFGGNEAWGVLMAATIAMGWKHFVALYTGFVMLFSFLCGMIVNLVL